MSKPVSHYPEGEYLIIKDVKAARHTISMQNDVKTDMIVRVEHNFDSFLVCDAVDETGVRSARRFPSSAADQSDIAGFESEQKKCR